MSIIENLVLHTASDAYWRLTVQIGFERLGRGNFQGLCLLRFEDSSGYGSDARESKTALSASWEFYGPVERMRFSFFGNQLGLSLNPFCRVSARLDERGG